MGFVEWMNSLPTGVGGMIGIAVGVVLVVAVRGGANAVSDWRERRRIRRIMETPPEWERQRAPWESKRYRK
jgi:hypothetical protein